MSMSGIFTVCQDELHHSVCTCADSRCCRTAQIKAASRGQCSSASLPRDAAADHNSGNTIRIHQEHHQGVASPLQHRWCPLVVGGNAACAFAIENTRPLGLEFLWAACRESP